MFTSGAYIMSLEYIRKTYNVPAKRGTKIEYLFYTGELRQATITGSRGPYLRCRLDKFGTSVSNFHPTWNIRYLPDGPTFGSDGKEPDIRQFAASNASQQEK